MLSKTTPTKSTVVLRTLCVPLVALAIGAAACSSSTQPSSSAPTASQHRSAHKVSDGELVAAAFTKTTAAKSAKLSLTATAGPTQITGTGATSFVSKTADVTLHTSQGEIRTLSVGEVTYTQLPAALKARLKNAKPWIKVDVGASGDNGGVGEQAPQAGDLLNYLQGLSSSVQKVGTESVRGTQTTHYRANVELAKVAAKAKTAAARKAVTTLQQQAGVSTFPVDLWLDGNGLVRRVTTSVPVPKSAAAGAAPKITIEFYDFGTPVNVTAPPASQVSDLKTLLGGTGH